jgi:hypothetical protein
MLFEMRTYQLPPSRLKDYLAIYAEKGKSLQCDVLGHLAGCYTTEVGDLNQVIFIWGFSSFEDRMRRRAALATSLNGKRMSRRSLLYSSGRRADF